MRNSHYFFYVFAVSLRMLCFHYSLFTLSTTNKNIRSIGGKNMHFSFSEEKKNQKKNQMCLQCRFTHIFSNGNLYHLRMSWLYRKSKAFKLNKRNECMNVLPFDGISSTVYSALINEHVKYDGFVDDAWHRTIVRVHISELWNSFLLNL